MLLYIYVYLAIMNNMVFSFTAIALFLVSCETDPFFCEPLPYEIPYPVHDEVLSYFGGFENGTKWVYYDDFRQLFDTFELASKERYYQVENYNFDSGFLSCPDSVGTYEQIKMQFTSKKNVDFILKLNADFDGKRHYASMHVKDDLTNGCVHSTSWRFWDGVWQVPPTRPTNLIDTIQGVIYDHVIIGHGAECDYKYVKASPQFGIIGFTRGRQGQGGLVYGDYELVEIIKP